jgi:hypothetical protein
LVLLGVVWKYFSIGQRGEFSQLDYTYTGSHFYDEFFTGFLIKIALAYRKRFNWLEEELNELRELDGLLRFFMLTLFTPFHISAPLITSDYVTEVITPRYYYFAW